MTFEDWPIYFKDRLLLGNPDSDVGIVTCWTPKELIAQNIPVGSFCALGQLYTKRGVNFLLRNVLARPCLRRLYVLGTDLRGGGEALIALAKNGVEVVDGRTVIKGVENGYIDGQISLEAIEGFRGNVKVVDMRGTVILNEVKDLDSSPEAQNDVSRLWRKPKIFPEEAVTAAETYPSEQTIFTVRRALINEAWVEILKHVLRFGVTEPTLYGGTKKELLNVVAVIEEEDATKPVVPAFMGMSQDDVQKYIDQVFKSERGEEPYTYGERLTFPVNQIDLMVTKLKRYPAEVGALAVLWQPEVDNFATRRPWRTPCLTLIQGVIRMDPGSSLGRPEASRLLLTAYFRSNDLFGAWPLNAWALRHLQAQIAERLGCFVGSLTTISSCAHIYDNALAEATKVVADNDRLACRTDPRGNYTIEVSGGDIIVRHLSPDGLVLAEYKQDATVNNATQILGNKLVQNLGFSEISHALDFGAQLARAEESVRHHLKFTQDRPLST